MTSVCKLCRIGVELDSLDPAYGEHHGRYQESDAALLQRPALHHPRTGRCRGHFAPISEFLPGDAACNRHLVVLPRVLLCVLRYSTLCRSKIPVRRLALIRPAHAVPPEAVIAQLELWKTHPKPDDGQCFPLASDRFHSGRRSYRLPPRKRDAAEREIAACEQVVWPLESS